MRRAGSILGLILASVALASCTTEVEPPDEGLAPSASIVLFSVTPGVAEEGKEATLRWVVANAVEIALLADGAPFGDPIIPEEGRLTEGSLTFDAEGTTRFRLEARGADEELVFEEVDLEVLAKTVAAIVEFRAEPAEIPMGETSALFWRTENAESIRIVDAGGEEVELLGARAEEGAVAVAPVVTTTYTLLAQGADGSAESTTTVTVLPAPSLSISADPELLEAGESSTLSWTTDGAERVLVRAGQQVLLETTEELSGELVVTPSHTTLYTVEAFGTGGRTEAQVEVAVQPRILSFTTDTVGQIGVGMLVDLRWSTVGATSLVLSNEEGFSVVITGDDVAAGSRRAPVGESGNFTLTAHSGELEDSSTFRFNLVDQPVILDFRVVSGPLTAGPDAPADVVVRWDVVDARSLTLVAIPGGEISLLGKSVDADEVVVTVYGPTTFVLTAENPNPAGPVSREVVAEVVAPPVIETFRAIPSRVGQGESTEISWAVSAAERIVLERGGARVPEVGPEDFSGKIEELLAADTLYRLRAFNSLDFEVVREFVVGIGQPAILGFDPDREWYAPGGEIRFSWRADGGTSLVLSGPGGTLHTTSDLEAIAEGSYSVPAPMEVGPASYTLTISNGAGSRSLERSVEITDGPVIERFEISPERLTAGEALLFSWQITTDASGASPTLTLVDNDDGSYDLSGADPLDGSASIVITNPGSYEFTLEARTGEDSFSRSRASALVLPRPELVSAQATPEYASNEGEPIVLEWQTLHADRLILYAIDDNGEVHGPAFHTTTQDVGMGTTTFLPSFEASHVRFVLENELGAQVEEDLRVGIGPASILSFEAEPTELFRGETTTLSWEIARATSVEIQIPDYVETDEEFFDISGRSTATQLIFNVSQTVSHYFNFPGGFTFPFDGTLRKGARVANSSWISFDQHREGGYTFKTTLPDPNRPYMHMTPFTAGEMNRGAHQGEIWYELFDGDTDSPYLIIQFKNMSIDGITTAVLNYQVVLRHDGSFDFRYGSMTNPPDQDVADGSVALIGYQNASGTKGVMVSRNTPYPGGLSYRTFHFPVIYRPVEVVATNEPFLDISGAGDAIEWTSRGENPQFFESAHVESFPDGFVFPFAGVDRTSVWIMRDGYLNFNDEGASSQYSRSTNLRMGEGYSVLDSPYVHLAPFWNYLVSYYGDTPGTVWTALREDAKGRFFVVQWKGFSSQAALIHQNSDLNFQVLLREDGTFEYRYGTMDGGSDPRNADGSLSTIGFQEPNGVKGVTLSFNTPVFGGLSGKAWSFSPNPQLPLKGELELQPRGEVEYKLVAKNEHSYHEKTQVVNAHARVSLAVSTTPVEPAPQQIFSIDWHTAGVTELTIEDSEGTVLHQVQGTTFDLRHGSYQLPAGLEMGVHRFTIRAQGFLGDSIVEELEILVFPPFSIDEFEAAETRIRLGETTTLSWRTTDVVGLSLDSDIDGPIDISGQNLASGSLQITPSQTTTYTLTATSEGRTKTATVVVEVRTISIESFEVSGADAGYNVLRGTPITVSWNTQGEGGVYFFNETRNSGRPDEYFMEDVSVEAPFEDIEGTAGATQITSLTANTSNALVALPFFFGLYDDERVGEVRVTSGGVIGLTGSTPGTTNTAFPDPSQAAPNNYTSHITSRIGIFWDNLNPNGVGKVHTKHIHDPEGVDQFIIQWKNMQFHHTTAANRDGNLNFQLVLYEDQRFEFRYGKMSGSKDDEVPATEDLALRAMGSTASIGFRSAGKLEDPSRDFLGQQVSFRKPDHNGFSNRSIRFTRSTTPFPANGTVRIRPTHSTDYRVCASSETWSECETFRIVVPQPGHLMITELQIDPVGADPVQWFEIRNLTLDPIDLEGMTLVIGENSVPINTGKPLVLGPAAYGVFSAKTSPSFDSLFTYGTEIDLRTVTSIEIRSGDTLMAKATWEPSWFAVRGTSLSLDTSMQRVGTVSVPALSSWCESEAMYDEENTGTPGRHGSTCLSQHYDVDYYSDRPFIDLRGVGMRQPEMVGRYEFGQVPPGAGFSFPFFDQLIFVDEMWSGNFGLLSFAFFENVNISPVNIVDAQDLNRQTPAHNSRAGAAGMIAASWFASAPRADLTSDFHSARLMIEGFEVFIIQWTRFSAFLNQYADTDLRGHTTHQLQIWENGDIVIAFDDIVGTYFNGSNATVGIVGPDGSPVLQYIFKEPLLTPYQSILYKKK